MTDFIPFSLPDITQQEIDAVTEVMQSGWLTTGKKTLEFEEAFKKYLSVPHALAVNSCTAALHLALEALNIKEGDEVIVPTMTFTATAEVCAYLRAKIVLADCDPTTFNIDPKDLDRKISKKTRAIIPVHLGGLPADMDPILDMARAHGAAVVEDSAHALPAFYKGRSVGTIGDVGCFSFYATKTITTGEGGMIVTSSDAKAARMKVMRLHGIDRDAWSRFSKEGSWYYEVIEPGFKYNMTDVASATGVVQLSRAAAFHKRRTEIASLYQEAFVNNSAVQTPICPEGYVHSWHLYILQLNLDSLKINRAQFIEELKLRGVGSSVHYIPLHLHPYYVKTYGVTASNFPVASRLYERIVSLPLYTKMSDADVARVADAVHDITTKFRR